MNNSEVDDEQNSKVVRIVGTYLVGPTIGKGYFARVKRVEDPYRQVFAMKCFDKERISRNSHTLKQVEKEINALRLCSHPSIAKFHEVLEVENSVYLIMEFVPHGELFEYIKAKGRLSEPEAVYMGKQIISALDYCHRAGIAHRDVKPENVLIDERHNIKLVDFGLCSFYRESNPIDPAQTLNSPDMASTDGSNQPQNAILNTQCGSPHYAAPEVLLGLGYDGPAADIWSFGVLLYAMVTGSLPFTARLIPQLVQKIVAGVYRMPSFLSPLCKHLLSGILRVNPRDRMTIEEIINHPWWTKTERWVPPAIANPISPSSVGASDLQVKAALHNAARQLWMDKNTSKNEVKICQTCGKSMRPRVDNKGMIVLSSTNTQDDLCQCGKKEGKAISPEDDEKERNLMQMPKLFDEKDHVDGDSHVPNMSVVDNKKILAIVDASIGDVKKTVASKREYDLMMAIDGGDIKKVKEIIYRQACPIFAAAYADDDASFTPPAVVATDKTDKKDTKKKDEKKGTKPVAPQAEPEEELFSSIPPGKCMCENANHRLDLRVGGIDNWTPLHYAARRGQEKIAEMLLLSCLPLDVNARTKNNWTPLMFAADKGHVAVVDLLLNYRADIHITSNDGKTAIFLAREHNFTEISQKLTQASSVRYMRSLQLQSSHTERNGVVDNFALQTELFEACEKGDGQKLTTLWPLSVQSRGTDQQANPPGAQNQQLQDDEAKVDFLAKGPDNWTVLHYAARRGHYDEILLILSNLFRSLGPIAAVNLINSTTKSGWTALMMAADRAHVSTAKLLIECGGDLHTKSRGQETLENLLACYKDAQHEDISKSMKNQMEIRKKEGWE